MFDSYELEKYIGKIGEQWHTISQLNILFEKFIIDKRYKEAIRTLSSMVSLEPKVSSSNRSQIDPNSRTLAIFVRRECLTTGLNSSSRTKKLQRL